MQFTRKQMVRYARILAEMVTDTTIHVDNQTSKVTVTERSIHFDIFDGIEIPLEGDGQTAIARLTSEQVNIICDRLFAFIDASAYPHKYLLYGD